MSNINAKYIRDEQGNIISPIVSSKSVIMGGGSSLEEYLKPKVLFWGGIYAYNESWVNVELNEDYTNYNFIYIAIGGSISEYTLVTFPVNKNITSGEHGSGSQVYKCEALSNYYVGGLINLNDNTKQISFNLKHYNGWSAAGIFYVIGRR